MSLIDLDRLNPYDRWIKSCSCDKVNASDTIPSSISNSTYKFAIVDLKKPEIKQIIFNGPATIVYWNDGSKTVVKCTEGDTFDPGIGIMMATIKKIFGDDYPKYKKSVKNAYDNAIWQKQKKENA